MRRFYYPTQDATIYKEFQNRQSGLDEILEIGKSETATYSIRSLIQFDIPSISASISAGELPITTEFDLKLCKASAERLIRDQKIDIHYVSESWSEGQGYFYQEPFEETEGVTWNSRNSGSLWNTSGSSYYTSPTQSYTLLTPLTDIIVSVSSMIRGWISGTYSNNGFILKFPDVSESSSYNDGVIKLFSKDTHTVFLPTLIAKWDDSLRSTGSLTASTDTSLVVYPVNLRPNYRTGEIVRVDITARPQYPTKTYSSTFAEWNNTYLPSSSYFSIIDDQSKEVVIPFDDHSKLSVDSNGNYCKFRIEKMFPRRYYRILFKVVTSSGYSYIFDNRYYFRIAD